MNYAKIDEFEYRNGKGIGISLFVSGCHFHCKDCFNSEAWDFGYGEPWNEEVENYLMKLLSQPHITRLSILGGEPLANENVRTVFKIISRVVMELPNIQIWLYTGYQVDIENIKMFIDKEDVYTEFKLLPLAHIDLLDCGRSLVVRNVDFVIDGRFDENEKDLSIPFRGSKNQRIIDIRKSINEKKIVLYVEDKNGN